jgi:hypothetical protein
VPGCLARASTAIDRPIRLSLTDAGPVLREFASEIPSPLRADPLSPGAWSEWQATQDRELRARLHQGDADSIINFILFGTSFTGQPRLTREQIAAQGNAGEAAGRLVLARIQDFTTAVTRLNRNERMQFAAAWLRAKGIHLSAPDSRNQIIALLLENTLRVLREQGEFSAGIAAAKAKGDPAAVFIERSSLYRRRGVSLDTSLRPCCGVARAIEEMKLAGLLTRLKRVAVLGPGLDFTDKHTGFDFYPVQTLQPFALIDSLRRTGLANGSAPEVTVFDLSERVLSHLRGSISHASAGSDYTVQIALDGRTPWLASMVDYWRAFGSEIGTTATPLNPPPGITAQVRAVRIHSSVVGLLKPVGLNVVIEHLEAPEDKRFDLIVATNVLVYYAPFEQGLALQNLAAMMRPGGVLLSNNALPEVPGVPIRPVGATSVAYSEDADDGDHMLWYRRV